VYDDEERTRRISMKGKGRDLLDGVGVVGVETIHASNDEQR